MESYYIITIDENGEPHLEHAWLRRGQAHKYIMKIGEGLKARYFYTQAEVDAYMNQGKRTVRNAADKTKQTVNNLTGATAKKQLEKAKYNDRLAQLATKKAESAVERARQNKSPDTGRLNIEALKAQLRDDETARQVKYSQKKYDKTPMGIAENASNKMKSAAQRLNENTKSKMDKMREEFRNTKEANAGKKPTVSITTTKTDKAGNKTVLTGKEARKEFSDAVKEQAKYQLNVATNEAKDKVEGKISDAKNSVRNATEKVATVVNDTKKDIKDVVSETTAKANAKKYNKQWTDLQKEADDIEKRGGSREAVLNARIAANSARINALNEKIKYDANPNTKKALDQLVSDNEKMVREADSIRKKATSGTKSKYGEYSKGDSDFADKNFDEKNRVGDSDFFMAKRPDGSTVILEEDMKWVLPKGVNPNDPAIKRALTKEYKAGSNEEWVKQVTEAIDDAVEEANKKK